MRQAAALNRDNIAVVTEDRVLTFAEAWIAASGLRADCMRWASSLATALVAWRTTFWAVWTSTLPAQSRA